MRNFGKLLLICLSSLIIWSIPANAQKSLDDWTLEEVLVKVAEANGGMEAIENVINARFIGTIEGNENTFDFVILKRRPNLMRSRLKQDEKVIETGFDGSVVWRRYEYRDYDKVEQVMDPDAARSFQIDADFDGPLIGDLPQGVERRMKGVERIDRIDYFVIEIRTEDSSAEYYVDSRTFRQLKLIKTVQRDGEEPLVTVNTFHELEKHNGIWVSRRVEKETSTGQKETIRIHTIEMNPGILDFSFRMPAERNPYKGN